MLYSDRDQKETESLIIQDNSVEVSQVARCLQKHE